MRQLVAKATEDLLESRPLEFRLWGFALNLEP